MVSHANTPLPPEPAATPAHAAAIPAGYLQMFEQLSRQNSAIALQISRIEDHAQNNLVSKDWIKRSINKPTMSDTAFHSMMSRHRIRAIGHRGYPRDQVETRLLKRDPLAKHRR